MKWMISIIFLFAGCNSVTFPDVTFGEVTTTRPDGSVSVDEYKKVSGGGATYFLSDSRTEITAERGHSGDIKTTYKRGQSVNKTLGKFADMFKAFAEVAD